MVDKYSGISKQSKATKVAFDDEGNAMTAFEKIAQGSANAETQTAAERFASVKRKIREADVEDLAVQKKRLKDNRRALKNKRAGRMIRAVMSPKWKKSTSLKARAVKTYLKWKRKKRNQKTRAVKTYLKWKRKKKTRAVKTYLKWKRKKRNQKTMTN